MNWREWPEGPRVYDYDTGDLDFRDPTKCPVCNASLRPVETYYTSSLENISFYTAICPHCRTKYERSAPAETVTVNSEAEYITELEERVRTLEETLSSLISWIRTQQAQPQVLPEKPQPKAQEQEASDDAEEFTRRYRYLL